MNGAILTIGDEILIGQTVDTNSAVIGQKMNSIGIDIRQSLSVPDEKREIIHGLKYLAQSADLILITGGLGPTKDDITKHALAEYFDDSLIFSEESYQRVIQLFKKRNIPLNIAHKEQFFLPSQATLLPNDMGTAPGMLFRKGGKIYFSMPGVPYEMNHLISDRLMPILIEEGVSNGIYHETLMTVGLGETSVASKISHITDKLSKGISLAFLPSLGSVKVRLTAKGENYKSLKAEISDAMIDMSDILNDYVYGKNDILLADALGQMLSSKKLKLGLAESCTGGHIGHLITSIPGSSAYMEGGVISYSYAQKTSLLGVKEKTLMDHGAVSEETVIEMQKGAIKLLNVDVSISVSGIAGPGGGTPDKPVGTIWMACGNRDKYVTKKVLAGKNRLKNMEYAGVHALNLLRQFINEVY